MLRPGRCVRLGCAVAMPCRTDQDLGLGDVTKFPADDLERLYGSDTDASARILGTELNKLLHVKTYSAQAWYAVTPHGVEKL